MEVIAILTGIALAVNKTVSVIKAITNKDMNGAFTQVLVWVVGIAAVVLAAHATLTESMIIPGLNVTLGSLDTPSHVLLGWILGGSGSFAFDIKKALDNSDNAVEPSLIPPSA